MAFEHLEWESAVSPLPYYMGDIQCVLYQSKLPPGIYIIRDCDAYDSQFLIDRGWQPLMQMAELAVERGTEADLSPSIWVEPLRPAMIPELVKLAIPVFEKCRVPNRLYRTLPEGAAHVLMTQWVYNSLTFRSVRAGVVWRAQGPVGFVTVRLAAPNVEQIDLLGVKPECRGLSFGKSLAAWAVETMQADRIQVVTERDNAASLKAYEAAGFEVTNTRSMFWKTVEA